MDQQISDNDKHKVYTSYYLEYMTARLYRRIFNFICLIQVILASTFMSEVVNSWFSGLTLAFCTGYLFTYKPGEIAEAAREQSQKYSAIIHCFHRYTPETLADKLIEIEATDSYIPESLRDPAFIKAGIAVFENSTAYKNEIKNLKYRERFLVALSGCLIK